MSILKQPITYTTPQMLDYVSERSRQGLYGTTSCLLNEARLQGSQIWSGVVLPTMVCLSTRTHHGRIGIEAVLSRMFSRHLLQLPSRKLSTYDHINTGVQERKLQERSLERCIMSYDTENCTYERVNRAICRRNNNFSEWSHRVFEHEEQQPGPISDERDIPSGRSHETLDWNGETNSNPEIGKSGSERNGAVVDAMELGGSSQEAHYGVSRSGIHDARVVPGADEAEVMAQIIAQGGASMSSHRNASIRADGEAASDESCADGRQWRELPLKFAVCNNDPPNATTACELLAGKLYGAYPNAVGLCAVSRRVQFLCRTPLQKLVHHRTGSSGEHSRERS